MQTFKTSYRVYYEDTDAGGVVYYANYLKFAERARTDYLREKGINQSSLVAEQGIVFVVHAVEAQYHAPGRLDDLLDVTVSIAEIKNTSLTMQQEISTGGKKLCSISTRIVCVNREMKPTRLPDIFN